jgi:uncharacterized membrane protein
MLVPLPIGLFVFSFVCDVIAMSSGAHDTWSVVALYTMGGGIVGALLAAAPGLIDLFSLPREPRKIGYVHMALNLTIVALYAVNFWLRFRGATGSGVVWLSLLTIAMLVVSGWLGGHMVYRHGVAVTPGEITPERQRADREHAYGGE